MYDYREAMTEDVKQWITDEVNLADWTEDRGGLEQQLNDDLWAADSVTGNGSGSYTFNRVSNVVSKCFPFCTTVLNNPVSGLKLQGHNIIGISLLNTRRAVALLTLSKVKPSFLKLYSLIIQDLLYSIVFCFQTPGRAGTLAA